MQSGLRISNSWSEMEKIALRKKEPNLTIFLRDYFSPFLAKIAHSTTNKPVEVYPINFNCDQCSYTNVAKKRPGATYKDEAPDFSSRRDHGFRQRNHWRNSYPTT